MSEQKNKEEQQPDAVAEQLINVFRENKVAPDVAADILMNLLCHVAASVQIGRIESSDGDGKMVYLFQEVSDSSKEEAPTEIPEVIH